ncbi:MAG: hypothetical protein AB1442_06530 [Nitrospirota bacterium]
MHRRGSIIISLIIKPFLIAALVILAFGLVYLRSSFVSLEYNLGDLEKKKMQHLKERKILLAERTNLLSFAKLETDLNGENGFVTPDRLKVIYINKQKEYLPYKASLEGR